MELKTETMVSMGLGVLSIALLFYFNRGLFFGPNRARGFGLWEGIYLVAGIAAMVFCWIENFRYFEMYGDEVGWGHWMEMIFTNPAAASAALDLTIANVILMPIFCMVDGRRLGMKAAWLYFPMSLVTSFAFGFAMYFAMRERFLRARAATAA